MLLTSCLRDSDWSVFTENGHDMKKLQNISKEYIENLNRPKPANESDETTDTVKLPWIPILGPKIRKAFRKKNIKTVFTSGPNLKQILSNNKSRLTPHSQPGIYELQCTCSSIYIGCLLYTSPSPRDGLLSRMPSSA